MKKSPPEHPYCDDFIIATKKNNFGFVSILVKKIDCVDLYLWLNYFLFCYKAI